MIVAKNLIFLSGSTREGSINSQLAAAACKLAKDAGANVELINLGDYELPLYDSDYEAENGIPEAAIALKKKFVDADGFFIASPEYNSSYPPLIKNMVDWLSRPHEENEPILAAFMDKGAAIAAASPGALGGIRVLVPLRLLLSNIGVNVVGNQLALGHAGEAFSNEGNLKEERTNTMLKNMIQSLIKIS